jgi:hypothetical protein
MDSSTSVSETHRDHRHKECGAASIMCDIQGDRLTCVKPSWFERPIIAAIPIAARLMSLLTGDAVLQVRVSIQAR